jgi:hypothetical protein
LTPELVLEQERSKFSNPLGPIDRGLFLNFTGRDHNSHIESFEIVGEFLGSGSRREVLYNQWSGVSEDH